MYKRQAQCSEQFHKAAWLVREFDRQHRSDRADITGLFDNIDRFIRIVYNQAQDSKILCFGNGKSAHIDLVFLQKPGEFSPVSYTHLDVYKRQIYSRGTPREVLTEQMIEEVYGVRAKVRTDEDGQLLIIYQAK